MGGRVVTKNRRPYRPPRTHIVVTDHAYVEWNNEFVRPWSRSKIAAAVRSRVGGILKVRVNHVPGRFQIRVGMMRVVLEPMVEGGWKVVTAWSIMPRDKEIPPVKMAVGAMNSMASGDGRMTQGALPPDPQDLAREGTGASGAGQRGRRLIIETKGGMRHDRH